MGNRIPEKVRRIVNERDEWRCLMCGAAAPPGQGELSHRIRRREGGHRVSNLARLCGADHRACHANPAWARETGFQLSAVAVVDPEREPVWSWRGWCLLDDGGGVRVIAPRTAEKPVVGA